MVEPITTGLAVAATASRALKTVDELTSGVDRLKKRIQPFKPAVRDLQLDYSGRHATLTVYVHAPEGMRRTFSKVEIPVDDGFQLKDIRTGLGQLVRNTARMEDNKMVVRASSLPESCEHLLFTFVAQVGTDVLDHLVSTSVAADPSDSNGEDRYWLASAINHPEILEKIYEDVAIDSVNVSVHVLLRRCFSTAMPEGINRLVQAKADLLRSFDTGDRNLRARAQYSVRRFQKRGLVTEASLAEAIADLISKDTLRDHIYATEPYRLASVDSDDRRVSMIPERIAAEAATDLNYGHRIARGSLIFRREKYKNAIDAKLSKLVR